MESRYAARSVRALTVLAAAQPALGAFGNLRSSPQSILAAPHLTPGSDDSTSAPVKFPHFLLRDNQPTNQDIAEECQCTLAGPCSCDSSIEFMHCVKNACESGKCGCEGYNEFFESCVDAQQHCPGTGLTCMKDWGTATCPRPGQDPLQVAMAPLPDKKPVTTPKPVPTTSAAKLDVPEPKLGIGIFPVPTASRCVVIMCCHYMIILTALAVVRTYHELTATAGSKVLRALRAGSKTLEYGPMLCVLFIACRMRVEFLSDGKDQPQMWVQHCMYASTFAVIATTLAVLVPPFFTSKPVPVTKDGVLQKPTGGGTVFYVMSATRYAIQLGLYGGIAGIMVGLCMYTPPGVTEVSSLPPPAPAVMCTMILTVFFFITHLAVAALGTYSELTGNSAEKLTEVMRTATDTVAFAPMLSILFLAARMRALQHDGQPQAWAQNCMYASTYAMALTTILAVAVPLLLGGHVEVDVATGQTRYAVKSRSIGMALTGIRYGVMVAMYAGACGVIVAIVKFESPKGPDHTLPVSPTVECVVNLCVQYFFIFAMLNVGHTLQSFIKAQSDTEGEPAIQVTFIQASGLRDLNFVANQLQAVCYLKQKSKRDVVGPLEAKTTIVKGTHEPFWNETYELGWNRGDDLEFRVNDIGYLDTKEQARVLVPSDVFYPNGFVGDVPLSGVLSAKLHMSIMVRQQKEGALQRFNRAVDAAKATVTFAPMLCILFVTTRMYALLITDKKGAPQRWVQDAMYMATGALMISFLMCMGSTALVDNVNLDEDGNVVSGFRNKYIGMAITGVRYLTMVLLYGGIITVIYGLFVMTPKTANGRGSSLPVPSLP